jgi:DNA-binding transcriptional LysR family regulator
MIEVNLLRYVLAAADTGSFSRAASRFGIKQSTLSKRVQFLELRLGLPIFRRSTRGVIPTYSGDLFLTRARRIIQDVDALAQDSRSLAKGTAGVLRLGFHASLAGGDLSATLKAYRSAFPGTEIKAKECSRTELLDALDSGRLDLAILTGQTTRPQIRSLCFWSEPITVAIAADSPLADRTPLYWTDLRAASFLLTAADPGPDISAMIAARLTGPGHAPSIIVQDVSRENLLTFVSGNGVAVTAGTPLPAVTALDAPVIREVHDAFGPTRLDQGVHWRADNKSPALRQFLDLLARRYNRALPAGRP